MPSFTFKGFATGAEVALSALQAGNSVSGSVPTWDETGGGGNVADLSIQIIDQSSLVAPAVMVFRAVPGNGFQLSTAPAGTPYEPWRHEITYIWSVRNAPLSFERAPHLNMPDAWKNANVYYGPEAVIAFDGPGTYHIDLVAVDLFGTRGVASQENIVIGNADAAFPGGATIVVSDSSNFTGAPVGATPINLSTSSWADMNNAITARGDNDTRVLMKAGVDFRGTVPVGSRFDFSQTYSSQAALGSFGNGAKPIIPLCKESGNQSGSIFNVPRDNTQGGAKFYDIELRGGWQADRERGYVGGPPLWRDIQTDILFHRAKISGHVLVQSQNRAGDCYFIWSDGEVTNWQDMGIFGFASQSGTKRLAIIGSDIHQHEDARQGNNKNGQQNVHGPLRVEDNENLHLHVVDFFSRNGWSTGFGANVSADQPCIRINSEGTENAKTIGDRMVLEGGWQVLNITGQDAGNATPDMPGNHVFDKLLTIGTPETKVHIECKYGGTTVRNGLAIEFDVPKYSGGIQTGMYEFNSDDTLIASNRDTPIAAYSNTFISLISAANHTDLNSGAPADILGVFNSGEFSHYTVENLVSYMPNQGTPDTTTPVDITTPMAGGYQSVAAVTPRFKGLAESLLGRNVTGNGSNTLTVPYVSLPDKNGSATNQAFWQARVAAGSTLHQIVASGSRLYADLNEFTVSYGSSSATVQRTDGGVFENGANITVKLDQSDTLDAPNAAYATTGFTVPAATLLGAENATGGHIAPDAFDLGARAGRGLPQAPGGTAQKGAI